MYVCMYVFRERNVCVYIYIYIYIYVYVNMIDGPLHVDVPVLVDQKEIIFNNTVQTQDVI